MGLVAGTSSGTSSADKSATDIQVGDTVRFNVEMTSLCKMEALFVRQLDDHQVKHDLLCPDCGTDLSTWLQTNGYLSAHDL